MKQSYAPECPVCHGPRVVRYSSDNRGEREFRCLTSGCFYGPEAAPVKRAKRIVVAS